MKNIYTVDGQVARIILSSPNIRVIGAEAVLGKSTRLMLSCGHAVIRRYIPQWVRCPSCTLTTAIDVQDLDRARSINGRWWPHWSDHSQTYYVYGNTNGKKVLLHRFILRAPRWREVDHKNHNGLDNRRSENLLLVGRTSNLLNRRGPNKQNTHGHRGVTRHASKRRKPWQARLTVSGKTKSLGYYATPQEASRAFHQALYQCSEYLR